MLCPVSAQICCFPAQTHHRPRAYRMRLRYPVRLYLTLSLASFFLHSLVLAEEIPSETLEVPDDGPCPLPSRRRLTGGISVCTSDRSSSYPQRATAIRKRTSRVEDRWDCRGVWIERMG